MSSKHLVAWMCASVCFAPTIRTILAQDRARGISYFVDTTTFAENALPAGRDAVRLWQAFGSFSARVTFAASRGRLDIVRRRDGNAIVVNTSISTDPTGNVGDYYLFDSTAVLLIRPASKTYSVTEIPADKYNTAGSREGWPRAFDFATIRFDTVKAPSGGNAQSLRPLHLYWHIDRVPYTSPPTSEIARGVIVTQDAPSGEFNVMQYFGASRALAHLVERGDMLPARVTITTAAPLRQVTDVNDVAPTLIVKRELLQLKAEDITLRSLILPLGYSQTTWFGRSVGAQTAAGVALMDKWRRLPVIP